MTIPRMTARLGSLALLLGAGLVISACHIVPPPVPGQPMTAEQQAYAKMLAQQEANERRRQDRCSPPGCRR
jgi:hypothetical protein